MLTLQTPELRLFWTSYDPLDLASGSIDVLGFQSCYIALADKFLPGFTTVTTSPRYVSMLCMAVGAAEAAFPGVGDVNVRLRHSRMVAVKSYERAWALACGIAVANGEVGDNAVDGLRGIQYVRRRLSELSGREKSIRTSSFNLLANQVRYGGIGAYSTMLEDCHLASMRSVTLRSLGVQMAESFPPPDDLAVWDEDKPLPIEKLREWGSRCHLGEFSREEGRCLTTALRGGEEAGWDDDVRWASLRLLAAFDTDGITESTLLSRLLKAIQNGESDRLKAPDECIRQIEAALTLIGPYERLYQAAQFLFDAARAAATDEPEVRLDSVATRSPCATACKEARKAASDLLDAIDDSGAVHPQTANTVKGALVETGVVALATALRSVADNIDLLCLVLDRHRDVQQGKFDRGERKAVWVRHDASNGSVRLTAQRHQLRRSDRYDSWDKIPWHPYRTIGARRFIQACKIR